MDYTRLTRYNQHMCSIELPQPTKPYKTGHSLLFSCQYHLICCPKTRRKVLIPPLEQRLKELIGEKQAAYGYEILAREIRPGQVQLSLAVAPRRGVKGVVGQMKGGTAQARRAEFPLMKSKLPSLWTRSKFISTVATVSLAVVKQVVANLAGK